VSAAEGAPLRGQTQPKKAAGREPTRFRLRLAVRLAVPVDRGAHLDAMRLTWSAILAALPMTVWLAAPVSALGNTAVLGLACATLPGVTATAWSAARLYDARADAARALRQTGAEQRSAWFMAAGRVTVFSGLGALTGGICVLVFHHPLGRLLPKHSPLRPILAVSGDDWLAALAATVILLTLGALVASSALWRRIDARARAVWASIPWSAAAAPYRALQRRRASELDD
jgi:hypothetical protein